MNRSASSVSRAGRLGAVAALCGLGVLATAGAGPAFAAGDGLPDDLAFLDNETVDAIVEFSENGSADCAALATFMGIGLLVGFASMSEDAADTPSIGAVVALTSPVLAPLLARASTPDDPELAAAVDDLREQFTGAIGELRDLGLTDDDLLVIQEGWGTEFAVGELTEDGAVDAATDEFPEGFEERIGAVLTHDIESITFFDEPEATGDEDDDALDALPWQDDCPETAAMFDFDMDPVSVTFDFEVTITAP